MGKRVGMEVSIAAAEAVKQANVDVDLGLSRLPRRRISSNTFPNWWRTERWMRNSSAWNRSTPR